MNRKFSSTAAVMVGLTLSQALYAQQTEIEEITVVGTGTSIRGVAPVGANVISIEHEDLLNTTSVDTTSFIRDLPQGSGLAVQEVQAVGGNVGFAQGINLRGLGNNATLVLFDGHRLVGQGVTSQFADPNQLPISAIERVEVVTDAASAVYGSDAIAGVVNFILRDDFEGLEVNARYTDSLYQATAMDLLAGFNWDSGNAWVGAMFEDRGTFRRNERPYLMQNLTQFGGNDGRISGLNVRPGPTPNIIANGTVYGVPVTGGRVPTAEEVLALEGQQSISDQGDEQNYWPDRERLAVSFRARQDILDDRGQLTLTGIYSKRESWYQQFNTSRTSTVRPGSPYWIDGLTNARSYRMAYSYYYNNQGPGSVEVLNSPVEDAFNVYLDLTYDLTDDWQFSANYTHGKNDGCGRCGKRLNSRVADAGYNDASTSSTAYSNIFNPFVQGPQTEFMNLVFGPQDQQTNFDLDRGSLKFEGGLFETAGGQSRVAFGVDHEETRQVLFLNGVGRANPPAPFVLRDTESDRSVSSAYVEFYVPVVGPANARPGMEVLNLSLAVRHDDYSDAGATTNPRIATTWEPNDALSFRASWGQAFRAPTLVETNPGVLEQIRRREYQNGANDPNLPIFDELTGTTPVIDRIGNTPGLRPETAEMWTLGLDITPAAIEGLRISTTYYDVSYEGRIQALPNQAAAIATPENRRLYDPFITIAPQPNSCVNGDFSTYNPLYFPYVNSPNLFRNAAIDDCTLGGIILGGTRNLGTTNQSGVDLLVDYDWFNEAGEWSAALNVSKILGLEQSLLPAGDLTEQLDSIGFQNSTRATGRVGWRQDRWSASLDATYIGSYVNDLPITVNRVRRPVETVDAWITLGANLTYAVPYTDNAGWLSGTRIGLSIDNLTDEDPPIVLFSDDGMDYANANPFGRIMSITVQKQF